jgi:hypothetical protein
VKRAFIIGTIFVLMLDCEVRPQEPVAPAYSGNQLLRDCTPGGDTHSYAYCLGYISGLVEGASVEADLRKCKPLFAISAEVDLDQLIDVVVKYLKEHPELRDVKAQVIALTALKAAFPPKS